MSNDYVSAFGVHETVRKLHHHLTTIKTQQIMTHQKLHGHDSPILTEAQVNIWYSDQQFSFRLFVLRVWLCLCEENNPILAF